jgi:outer membrane protein assembly factor BamB
LYTDSIVKLSQATGKLEWYYQAFPDDFHDWDLQISPIYTTTPGGHPVVLAAGKGGFVFAFDAASGKPLWTTALAAPSLGGATVSNDLVFTATLTGEVVALSRQNGSIAWTAQLPSYTNAPLAIVGNTLLAGVTTAQPEVVAYRVASV